MKQNDDARRRRRRRCDAARGRVAEESGELMGNVRRLVGRCREKVLLASHASASGVITYEWSAFVFFGLCVHFRALNAFSVGFYGSAEHDRTMDDGED